MYLCYSFLKGKSEKKGTVVNIKIFSTDTRIAIFAVDLFGSERVSSGDGTMPIFVSDLDQKEVDFAEEFFAECDVEVQVLWPDF